MKSSQSSQIDLNHDDENWRCGAIKSMTLQNFMCHSNFHLTFNPRINFISGLNGSGKSAVQTAIVVGFGGRASVTDRGSSLKSLIKFGCPSATVSITIANSDVSCSSVGPFKPEVYGKEITISRTISESGSNAYKILNEHGKVVKGSKNELKSLTFHFNILIDNPICVMNQTMVKRFHKSANPNDKYNLFYSAISADVYNSNIEETKLVASEYSEKLSDAKAVLDECNKEMLEYEAYEKKSRQLEELNQKKCRFENEYAWYTVCNHEKKYQESLNKIETLKNGLLQGSDREKLLTDRIDTSSKTLELKNIEFTNAEEISTRNNLLLVDIKKKLAVKTAELEKINEAERKYRFDLKLLNDDKVESERLIKIEHQKGNTNTYAELKENLKKYEQRVGEVDAAWKSNVENEKMLKNTVDDLKQKIYDLKNNETTRMQRKVGELNRNINSISNEQSRIHFYGNWMPKLVETIDNVFKQNKFTKKPIGPIGEYIKVNNDKWIFSVENFLGRNTLKTFLVDNFADNKVLQSIMDKIIPVNVRKPSIITSKFIDRVHNISSNETKNSFMRMLTFTSPVVANCLIDNNRIESIMLVESNEEAMSLMENSSTVPRCCNFCLTKDGTQVYPSPSYRVYSLQNPFNPVHLQSDMSVAVNNMKREKAELEVKIVHLNKEVDKIETSKLEKQQLLKQAESHTILLKKRLDENVKQVNYYRSKCEEENDDILSTLTEEMNEIKSKIEKVNRLLEESQEPVEDIVRETKLLEEKLHETKSIINKNDRSSIRNEILTIQAKIDKMKSEKLQISKNLGEQKKALNDLIKKTEEDSKNLEQVLTDASLICERIEVTRSKEDIWKDIEAITKKYSSLHLELEKSGKTHLALRKEYKKKKEEYLCQLSLYKQVKNMYKDNTKSIEQSAEALKNYVNDTGMKVIQCFSTVFDVRLTKGSLTIDHENQSMVINMTNKISTSCASGGERTYATVALILALWNSMQLPFYSIDEYDVFMDNVNRLATTDLLMKNINGQENQHIFLTPQDISYIRSGPNVKVVKLKEPRS